MRMCLKEYNTRRLLLLSLSLPPFLSFSSFTMWVTFLSIREGGSYPRLYQTKTDGQLVELCMGLLRNGGQNNGPTNEEYFSKSLSRAHF